MRILTSILILLLAGCATTNKDLVLTEGKAVLVAMNDATFSSMVPLSAEKHTRFKALNGNEISDAWNSTTRVEVEPGLHKIEVSCNYRQGGLYVHGETTFEDIFEKNKVYKFTAFLDGNSKCSVLKSVI